MYSTTTAPPARLSPENSLDSEALSSGVTPDAGQGEPSAPGEPPMAQEPLPRPAAAVLEDIELSLPHRTAEKIREAGEAIGAQHYAAWVPAAADVVFAAMQADIQSGHLPHPAENPAEVERALAARADEAVRQSPFVTTFGWREAAFQILRHAQCGPADQYSRFWHTPIEPFVEVELEQHRQEDGDADTGAAARPAGLCVLRPGERHPAPMLGFRTRVQWVEYAWRVLRDDVLCCLANRITAQRSLLLDHRLTGGPEMLPCRVHVAPPAAATTPPKRKRRGH